MKSMMEIIEHATSAIKRVDQKKPTIGLILGSGLGDYAMALENKVFVDYETLEGFPVSKVDGHKNRFVLGDIFGKHVIAMQGRFHYYEGYPQDMIALGVRVMKQLGVEYLLITNAAGGVNTSFSCGTLMAITDHINFSGSNPLFGENLEAFGPRFPDVSNAYDRELRMALLRKAKERNIVMAQGVYMMFSGPCYETPAEVRMARALGADAVGMSTVPEVIAAAHCGLKTVGISLITNLAAGILDQPLSHEEVKAAAVQASERFQEVVNLLIAEVFA